MCTLFVHKRGKLFSLIKIIRMRHEYNLSEWSFVCEREREYLSHFTPPRPSILLSELGTLLFKMNLIDFRRRNTNSNWSIDVFFFLSQIHLWWWVDDGVMVCVTHWWRLVCVRSFVKSIRRRHNLSSSYRTFFCFQIMFKYVKRYIDWLKKALHYIYS